MFTKATELRHRSRRFAVAKLIVLAGAALASVVLLVPAGRGAGEEDAIRLKKADRIVFGGDSLTQQGVTQPGDGPPGYVNLVRDALTTRHKDLDIVVIGTGSGGLLSSSANGWLAKKATVAVIQGGVPEALGKTTKEQFKASLEKIIDQLHKNNIRVVLCTLTTYGEKHDGSNKQDQRLEEFAQAAREVAKEKKVVLNDLRTAFMDHLKKNNPDNKAAGILTNDGNHFNEAGQRFMAEQMLKKLK